MLNGALTIQNLANPRPPLKYGFGAYSERKPCFICSANILVLVTLFPKGTIAATIVSDSSLSVDPRYPTSILSRVGLSFLPVVERITIFLLFWTEAYYPSFCHEIRCLAHTRIRPRSSQIHGVAEPPSFPQQFILYCGKTSLMSSKKNRSGEFGKTVCFNFIVLQILLTH